MPTPEQIAQMAEVLGDNDWLEFLDQLDADSRRRRQRQAEPEPPNGQDRDEVAAWIARSHFLADSAIRQVWYLPEAAPPNEIRFLEVKGAIPKCGHVALLLDCCSVDVCVIISSSGSLRMRLIPRLFRGVRSHILGD